MGHREKTRRNRLRARLASWQGILRSGDYLFLRNIYDFYVLSNHTQRPSRQVGRICRVLQFMKMSRKGVIPVVLAVGFGIANGRFHRKQDVAYQFIDTYMTGYITFNPAFQEMELEKFKQKE